MPKTNVKRKDPSTTEVDSPVNEPVPSSPTETALLRISEDEFILFRVPWPDPRAVFDWLASAEYEVLIYERGGLVLVEGLVMKSKNEPMR
ncbi:unnamed protein product [Soboliphyme baturini]|uniref:DUF4912 domain-containing protein n=1 Tax=Soboliphyme baturini TaxID=241478 RepID=A0A183IZ63_9BILA|nr:unnamed protein product [Soboliphyme baturini]